MSVNAGALSAWQALCGLGGIAILCQMAASGHLAQKITAPLNGPATGQSNSRQLPVW